METEGCPVCWRAFTIELLPVVLPCGHSFCLDCGSAIRSCSLCRHRLPANYLCKVNYSLASVLDKMAKTQQPAQVSIQTQTDEPVQPSSSVASRRPPPPSFLDGKAVTVHFRRSGMQLRLS